jgi:hypothetical protein
MRLEISWARCADNVSVTITAIFESWHIGDGTYPPLHRGQQVNLSFEMEVLSDVSRSSPGEPSLVHEGGGHYRFAGEVLRVYNDNSSAAITIIESAGLRFYVNRSFGLRVSEWVQGDGKLVLDHYIWVENLGGYKDPPDLFYQLRVSGIHTIRTPERFISRHPQGKSFPGSLPPASYGSEDMSEIETMEGQPFDEEFYLLDLTDEGLGSPVARTFT